MVRIGRRWVGLEQLLLVLDMVMLGVQSVVTSLTSAVQLCDAVSLRGQDPAQLRRSEVGTDTPPPVFSLKA